MQRWIPLLVLALPAAMGAQVIPVRTLPAPPAYQFEIFPSLASAMGGVSIAVDDPLLDPFTNPSKASRLEEARLFGSPGVFSLTDDAGGGRTLPLGALGRAGPWFGGVALGLQQVDLSEPINIGPGVLLDCAGCGGLELEESQESAAANRYGFAMLGRDVGEGLALGASVLWSTLGAVDGVHLLYPGSVRLEQLGHAVDVRLGALVTWEGERTLDVLLLYNRLRTEHEATYLDQVWDPGARTFFSRARVELNPDRTDVWGLRVEHERPLGEEGWRIGWSGTANVQRHGAIPAYELARVPKDAGRSTALDLGVGVSRREGSSTFGIDLVYEPIWSRTRADAPRSVETDAGDVIPAGGEIMENRVRFSNVVLRMGIADEAELTGLGALGVQLGLETSSIGYELRQTDHVRIRTRRLSERWTEWTPTWGLTVRRPSFEVRYQGRATSGIRQPDVRTAGGSFGCTDLCLLETPPAVTPTAFGPGASTPPAISASPVGVGGPFQRGTDALSVSVHQVSFSIPLGWGGPARAAGSADGEPEGSR